MKILYTILLTILCYNSVHAAEKIIDSKDYPRVFDFDFTIKYPANFTIIGALPSTRTQRLSNESVYRNFYFSI